MRKVSACILTYNEELYLPRLLQQLSFCDEIVVLDHHSLDRTPQIAQSYPKVRFVQEPFRGFRTQKTRLLELASHDWILCLDADELLDVEALSAVKDILTQSDSPTVFRLPRKNKVWGKWIRHGGWYPDYQTRFFRKTDAYWDGPETHEYVHARAFVATLPGNIEHDSFIDLSHQVRKYNFYSSRVAQDLSFSWVALLTRPVLTFLRMYIFKRGFLDGVPGFVIAVNTAYYTFLKYAKAWETQW